jgi:hypothetical protein
MRRLFFPFVAAAVIIGFSAVMVFSWNLTEINAADQLSEQIKQAMINALPKVNELPIGYSWTSPYGIKNTSSADSVYASQEWTVKRSLKCQWGTSNDDLYVRSYLTYDEGGHSYFEKTAEQYQSWALSSVDDINSIFKGGKAYNALPGGVIIDNSDLPASKNTGSSCTIYFWSPKCDGNVVVRVYHNTRDECNPPWETRRSQDHVWCKTECERIAKIVYSRLPDTKGWSGSFVPGQGSAQQSTGQSTQGQNSFGQSGAGQTTQTSGNSSTNSISDTALPLATGAAAGLLALGTWLITLTSGVPFREIFSDIGSLFSGKRAAQISPEPLSTVSPEPTHWGDAFEPLDTLNKEYSKPGPGQVTEIKFNSSQGLAIAGPAEGDSISVSGESNVLKPVSGETQVQQSPEEKAAEEVVAKKAFEDLKKERGQFDYTSEESSKDLGTEARKEVAAQYKAEKENIIGYYDKLVFESFIIDNAPNASAREEMTKILNANLTLQREDGSYIGNKEKIRRDLTDYLQRAKDADKSMFSCDEIDSDFEEKLEMVQNNKSGKLSAGLETVSAINEAVDTIREPAGLIKDLKELADEKDLNLSPGAKDFVDYLRKKTEFFDSEKLENIGEKIGNINELVDVVDYQTAYKMQGLNATQAWERALERKVIEMAVDKGVDKIPILKMADTIGSKGGELLFGKDLGAKNLFTFLSQRTSNYAHGDYTTYTPEFINDAAFRQQSRDSSILALEKLISTSSEVDKPELQSMLIRLKGAG